MNPSTATRIRVSSLLAAALPLAAHAQFSEPAGSSGYKLLKLDISPRAAALSGAGTALPELEQGISPAISVPEDVRLSAGWTSGYSRFEGEIEHASWVVPAPGGAAFGRLRFQGFQDLEGYDTEDRSTGTYTASTWAAGFGYAVGLQRFVPGLSTGIALHGGMNHVAAVTSFAGWGDLGVRWSHGAFSVGAAVRNWGLASESDQDPETLPLQAQIGGSYTRALPSNWTLAVLTDARWTVDESWTLPVALESRWGVLALRTGYALGLDESRPSFGVGVQGSTWGVDASLAWHDALGLSPGMSISAGL